MSKSNSWNGVFPDELAEAFDRAYFLHVLATDPSKIIPPGKSLLSMMTHAQLQEPVDQSAEGRLHDVVEKTFRKVFWDEAIQTLSAPIPSQQLSRLKSLYSDLLEALSPLLPHGHPVLVSLASPLPPTSSPLRSTLSLLNEILVALRQRCAPARDHEIDAVLQRLNQPPSLSTSPDQADPTSELAIFTIEIIKSILLLLDELKDDLRQYTFGTMTEPQLRVAIAQEARSREKELVIGLWQDSERGHHLSQMWRTWIKESSPPQPVAGSDRWTALFRALSAPIPIACVLPQRGMSAPLDGHVAAPNTQYNLNILPPQFLFSVPSLLRIQNQLQALVIVASLRTLIPFPSDPAQSDFVNRVWLLLKDEIDEGDMVRSDRSPIKLINLADEVTRTYSSSTILGDNDREQRIRAAVERVLRPQDPVFNLLQRRLIDTLTQTFINGSRKATPSVGVAPKHMKTGILGGSKATPSQPAVEPDDSLPSSNLIIATLTVPKGFEDPVLVRALQEVAQDIAHCMGWVEWVWGDTMYQS